MMMVEETNSLPLKEELKSDSMQNFVMRLYKAVYKCRV